MELNNSNNAFEMTLLYPEARFVIIDIARNKDDLNRLVRDGDYYDIYSDFSIRNVSVLQIKSLTQSDVLVQYIRNDDLAKYNHIGEALVGEKTYNVEMPTKNIGNGISSFSLGYTGMTLLYPEARIICIDIDSTLGKIGLNKLLKEGSYWDGDYLFSIKNARVLQIQPFTKSDVLVQYISEEDLAKYYQKNEELVDEKNVRERIIRDISSSKRIIKDEEVEGSLGSISTLTKQLITDNEFFGEDYKLELLSFLDMWEKMISERQEIDFLITRGYLDQSIKNNFAEPLNTDPMIAAKVYNFILSGLIYRTEEFCERDIKSNEEKHIKVKQ